METDRTHLDRYRSNATSFNSRNDLGVVKCEQATVYNIGRNAQDSILSRDLNLAAPSHPSLLNNTASEALYIV